MNKIRLVTIAIVGLLAVATALMQTPAASAHARLKTSTPGTGEVVQTSPSQVVVMFTEDIQKVAGTYDLTVAKDRGPFVTSGPSVLDETDRSKLSVPLQPALPAGRYVVTFKNVSDDDGDPFNGAFAFYVQTQPTAVDLANDQQLAQIGAEEITPGADTTAGAGTAAASPAAVTTAPASPVRTSSATAVAAGTSASDSSNTGRNVAIAVGVVVVLIVLGAGAWYASSRRRT